MVVSKTVGVSLLIVLLILICRRIYTGSDLCDVRRGASCVSFFLIDVAVSARMTFSLGFLGNSTHKLRDRLKEAVLFTLTETIVAVSSVLYGLWLVCSKKRDIKVVVRHLSD